MTVHLVTFSDDSMSRARDLCEASGLVRGVDVIATPGSWRFTWEWFINTDLYERTPTVFWRGRGLGFWAWKPYVIERALRGSHDGDILIYSDAGVEFINNVSQIIDRVDQDIFLFGNQYEHAHWCKRDIVEEIWPSNQVESRVILSAMDVHERVTHTLESAYEISTWARFSKQVQASVIFFRVNDYTKAFVKEWLDWCLFEGGRLIDDSPSRTPNHPEFQENRHDQAILTTMAYRDGLKLHWWGARYNMDQPGGGFLYPKDPAYASDAYEPLFHHHRKRNHEWASAA